MLDGRRSSPLELLFPGWQGWTESRKFPARLGPLLVPALPVWRSPGLGHAQASSCPHHISPFPQHFPHLDLTLFSFCLPIPRQSTMQVWISAVFLSFPVPTACPPCWVHILQVSGSALSLSTAAVSLRRQGCVPALPSISYPPSSLSISGSLVQIWTQAFLTVLSSLLSPSPWKRHCKYIPLLCLVFSLIYISKGVDLPPFPWRDYSRT